MQIRTCTSMNNIKNIKIWNFTLHSPCSLLTSIADFRSSNLNKGPADILADK